MQCILVTVGRTAGAKSDDDVSLPAGHRIQQRTTGRTVGDREREVKRILRVVKSPFSILADNKRQQAVDRIGAVRKMDPEFGKVKPRSEVGPVPGGLDHLPAALDIL